MTIQLTAVLDIALTHTADFESAITTLAKTAPPSPVCSTYSKPADPDLDGGRHA